MNEMALREHADDCQCGQCPPKPYTSPESEPRIYRIIRFRENCRARTVRNNVTLTEAREHCRREDTHGIRAGVRWFDGYDYMPGCRPRERA
jgi:hypothetical protein